MNCEESTLEQILPDFHTKYTHNLFLQAQIRRYKENGNIAQPNIATITRKGIKCEITGQLLIDPVSLFYRCPADVTAQHYSTRLNAFYDEIVRSIVPFQTYIKIIDSCNKENINTGSGVNPSPSTYEQLKAKIMEQKVSTASSQSHYSVNTKELLLFEKHIFKQVFQVDIARCTREYDDIKIVVELFCKDGYNNQLPMPRLFDWDEIQHTHNNVFCFIASRLNQAKITDDQKVIITQALKDKKFELNWNPTVIDEFPLPMVYMCVFLSPDNRQNRSNIYQIISIITPGSNTFKTRQKSELKASIQQLIYNLLCNSHTSMATLSDRVAATQIVSQYFSEHSNTINRDERMMNADIIPRIRTAFSNGHTFFQLPQQRAIATYDNHSTNTGAARSAMRPSPGASGRQSLMSQDLDYLDDEQRRRTRPNIPTQHIAMSSPPVASQQHRFDQNQFSRPHGSGDP